MGVAKDVYPHDGDTHSYVVGFAEVEVDVETGAVRLVEYTAVADVGTVINPRSLGGQILGGGCLGIGHALSQKSVYDQQYGVALARRFHHNKPLTILDVPGRRHAPGRARHRRSRHARGRAGCGRTARGRGIRGGAGRDCRRRGRRRCSGARRSRPTWCSRPWRPDAARTTC